jgi:hypothetical protein
MVIKVVKLEQEDLKSLRLLVDSHIDLGHENIRGRSLLHIRRRLLAEEVVDGNTLDRKIGDVKYEITFPNASRIIAIKLVRELTAYGLVESKNIVDKADRCDDTGGYSLKVENSTTEEFRKAYELLSSYERIHQRNLGINLIVRTNL